jgi:hypothetical protein
MAEHSGSEQLERDLAFALRMGRWPTEDEQVVLRQEDASVQAEKQHHLKLMLLAAVCLLLPPLWPLGFATVFYLLFPKTAVRLGLAAGVVLVLITTLLVILSIWFLQWLL